MGKGLGGMRGGGWGVCVRGGGEAEEGVRGVRDEGYGGE